MGPEDGNQDIKENRDIDAMKITRTEEQYFMQDNSRQKRNISTVNTAGINMSPRGSQSMAGAVKGVRNATTLNRCARTRADRCQRIKKLQNSLQHVVS